MSISDLPHKRLRLDLSVLFLICVFLLITPAVLSGGILGGVCVIVGILVGWIGAQL